MDFENNTQQQDVVDQQEQVLETSHQELEQCKMDVALWKEQASRIFADFDNYKKRIEKEQVSWMQTAQSSILKDLLSTLDNFDRALTAKTEANADMYAGIDMIYKSLLQTLQKYGVKEFASYNEFDPEFHEALMNVDSTEVPSGHIVQVLEKGFMLKDKVLRPAKVVVAK